MAEQEALNHKIDRTGWPAGLWDEEPEDRVDFLHSGFACLLLRNRMGAWCGYVGVGPDHPLHGKDYEKADVEVHGGLTYADACGGSICHVPKPGMPEKVWWFGFDCIHSGDVAPGSLALDIKHGWEHIGFPYESYKTAGYARSQTERLAEQLNALGKEKR